MFFPERSRETLDRLIPGLSVRLSQYPLARMEAAGNPGIADFKRCGGPALMIPRHLGGQGATPLEACQVQQAIAAQSPSLAVAAMMHHFSAATLVEMAAVHGGKTSVVLEMVARENLIMASGFAEGGAGASILRPFTRLTKEGNRYLVSGSKKPCSLAHSMDLLTLSVLVPADGAHAERMAVAVLPASAPGIERKAFWNSPILAGAESDELILNSVPISERSLSFTGRLGELDEVQIVGFLWFVLLCTSSYLGAAANLAEKVLAQRRGSTTDRTRLAIEMEGANAAMEAIAARLTTDRRDEHLLAHALLVRYSVQQSLERATMLAAELLGGLSFMTSHDTAYFLSAARALAFHPPSRASMSDALANYLAGEAFQFAAPPISRAA